MSPVVTILSSLELSVALTCHASSVSLLQYGIDPQSSFHTLSFLWITGQLFCRKSPQFRCVWDLLKIRFELCVFGWGVACLVTNDVHLVVFSKLLDDKLLIFLL